MKLNKWFPALLLLFIWYVPRNTAPGSFFENYVMLRWSTYLIIPLILGCFLLRKLLDNPKMYTANLHFPIISIFLIIVLSGVINNSSPLEIAFTILTYLRYPLLFIVLINMNSDKKVLTFFIKGCFFLVIIQIPEVFYRFFVLGIKWDYVSWTLGPWGTFDLGVCMIYATALMVANDAIVRLKLMHIILIISFFLVALMGEIKAFLFFTPVVAGFIIYNCVKKKIFKMRTFMIVGMFIVVIGVAFIFSIKWYPTIFPKSKSLAKISAILRGEKGVKLYRISSLFDIVSSVKMDASNLLLGWGPGASLVGSWGTKRGVIFEFPIQHKNQLSETFVDIGVTGMILYYWLLISLFGVFRRHIKLEDDTTYIVLNRALMGMWLFYAIMGPFYDLVWRADSSNFIFYWLLAALYTRYRSKKKEKRLMDITKSEYLAGG